ncbi:hypothetical protein P1J78_22055 [Psychromarinibacter sp. C21-152]|uniref:Peptidase C-terminal archaeal/bacterial domain-containing protein n=1 Tax=Psychromarinibacter sediminicola TaxID=3033385 RepID=A0AAE3NXE8_9RHOB|nr:hypothetical protein [Psychromarinibacter sediminicola]MDF0603419.1 hypothetical protein [Psychromarinibacter sediminicola]
MLLLLAWPIPAMPQEGIDVFRLRGNFVPGSTGNRVLLRVQNLSTEPSPEVSARPQLPLQYVAITDIAPPVATVAPGAIQDFVVTFDIRGDAPVGSGEAVTLFVEMGSHVRAARYDVIVDFVGAEAPLPPPVDLPEMDFVEMHESFEAGTQGNAVVFRVENTTAFPVKGLNLRPELPLQYLTLDRIEPQDIDLEPGEEAEITAEFSVRQDAEVGGEDIIEFYFEAESDIYVPLPKYRLIATVEEGEPVAACNSAVDAGGDEGGGVEVDLGGFTGKAGFTWEMFTVKDQMDVTVGGVSKTTGCVGGAGTFEFDVPPGARIATVKVVPNCEGTTGTQWNFTFECPLVSDVTADGDGNELDLPDGPGRPDGAVVGIGPVPGVPSVPGQLTPQDSPPTVVGAPVVPAPPSPPPITNVRTGAGETEPNNDHTTATPVTLGGTVSGTITPRGDYDHYAVSVAHQGELTVRFPTVPPGINIAFRVKDADGGQVWGWQGAEAQGAAFSAWVDLKVPGDYVIEVRDGSSNAASDQPYTMLTSFIPTADGAEPNDAYDTATPLAWNAATRANILPRGDFDHYRVVADRMGQLTLQFTKAPPELNMAFRIKNAAGGQVWGWQGANSTGAASTATADLPAPGTYIIEVRDGSSDARSAVPYEMVASLNPAFDGGEPNNDYTAATPVEFGAQVWANILPRGDYDHYRVEIAQQGELTVYFNESPDELNMAFRVKNETGGQVWGWQGAADHGETFHAWADLKTPGVYIVEVRDGSSDARSPDPYGMVISFRPTADPAEPNDDHTTATPLAFDIVQQANILPRGDYDHYRVTAPHQGELTVDFSASPANLNMAFRVKDVDGGQVWGWQGATDHGETFRASADLKAPGDYVIEVRDGSSDARSPEPYSLTARFVATPDPAEPNDDHTTATPISLGERVAAAILPRGDYDHYRLDVPDRGELMVDFSATPDNLNMAFRVKDVDGGQVWGWQGVDDHGKTGAFWVDLAARGTYVLEIRDGSSDARSVEEYVFTTGLKAAADSTAEPNDALGDATPLAMGVPVQGTILPRGDRDHYAFSAASTELRVSFSQAPANLNMAFRVLDTGGGQVLGWHSAPYHGAAFVTDIELPGPGRYVLEVRDGSSDARSPDPYTLVIGAN